MNIVLHKDLIGYSKHVQLNNGKFVSVTDLKDKSVVSSEPNNKITELLKLNGYPLPMFPVDEKYRKQMSIFKIKNQIPWSSVLPKDAYINNVQKFFENLEISISECKTEYQNKIWPNTNEILINLHPCKIDGDILHKHLLAEDNASNRDVLLSFDTNNDGFLIPTIYDRETKTGRFRVKSGPNILRLKREYRNILKSRFTNGKIYYVDYKSLEPRTLLALTGHKNIPADLYSYVIEQTNIEGVSRDKIKLIILSELYGAASDTIKRELKELSTKEAENFIQVVSEFFSIDSFKEKLLNQLNDLIRDGIYNHYGRWIDCTDIKPYMIINYFIQSTAVDITTIGFNQIIKNIANSKFKNLIYPCFILHDALIIDVEDSAKDALPNFIKLGESIEGFKDINFYLELSEL